MTTSVRHIPLTRKLLTKLPQSERKWVFFLGHVANEITLLNKLVLWSHQMSGGPNELRNVAAAVQTIMLSKMLAGKQYEAAEVLQQSFFGSAIERLYQPLMRGEGQQAEEKLRAYFTGNNLHYRVRNSFAFHYSLNHMAGEITPSAKVEELQMILSENAGNTLFDMSETVVNRAMLRTIDPSSIVDAIEKFTVSVIETSALYQRFIDDFIEAVLRKHWGNDYQTWGGSDVDVPADDFDSIHIPWFFSVPRRAP